MSDLSCHVALREKIEQLERENRKLPQIDCPIAHYFAPGIYAREINVPAGTIVTGAVHKTENLIIISIGRVVVALEDGSKEYTAGDTFTCKAGAKNAFVALEDSRWTNFCHNVTNEKDPEVLAEIFTESKNAELLGGVENKQLINQGAKTWLLE